MTRWRGAAGDREAGLRDIVRRGLPTLLLALALGLAVLALGACGTARTDADARVLRLNLGGEPQTLDPQRAADSTSISVLRSLYAALLRVGPDLSIVPDLAAEVPTVANGGISEDGLTYTFHLRPGLTWSDGAPLTARAFVDGAQRLFDPANANPYVDFYRVIAAQGANARVAEALGEGATGPALEALERAASRDIEVSAPDDLTVVYRLRRRSPAFLSLVTLSPLYPVRADLIEEHGDRWTEAGHLVGNGPFTLVRWDHGQQIVLARNDRYHGGVVPLDGVRFDMIGDSAIALLAYERGELDITTLGPTELVRVRDDQALRAQFHAYAQLSTQAVYFNAADPLLDDARVRQALSLALDRPGYAEVLREGAVLPATAWIPPGMPGYDAAAGEELARPSLERARALLRDAGHEDGRGIELRLLVADASSARTTAQWLQEQWERGLGVGVQLVVRERAAYFEDRVQGRFQVVVGGWSADYADPENWLPQFRSGSGLNPGGFSDAAFDGLIDQAALELDQTRRLTAYRQAQRLLIDDAAIAPLAYGRRNILVQPWVKNLVTSPMEAEVPGDLYLDRAAIARR